MTIIAIIISKLRIKTLTKRLFALFLFVLVNCLYSIENIKTDNEIYQINGDYAGKVSLIGSRYWLDGKTDITDGIEALSATIPPGFKLPNKKDLEILLAAALTETDPEKYIRNKLKIDQIERYLMSSDKVYPDKKNGSDIEAWKFYGLDLNKMSVEEIATYAIVHEWYGSKKSEYSARFVANIDPITLVYNGIGGTIREFESNLPGVMSYKWRIDNKEYNDRKIKHNFKNTGVYDIKLVIVSDSGEEEYSKKVKINKLFGSYENYTSIDVNNIVVKDLDFVCAYPEYNRYGYAKLQVAPLICSDSGRIFILFADTNKDLTLIETDLNGEVESKQILHNGFPGALSFKGDTIAYLTKIGRDRADLRFVDKKGNDVVIMDNDAIYDSNGMGTVNSGRGLIFRDESGKMAFGTEAMYEPFAFGRVELFGISEGWISIFPHTNNLNASNITIGEHNGDKGNCHSSEICIMFNDDASENNLIYGWGASHSMDLRSVYDGDYIASVTLGDVYPCDFKLFIIDPSNKKLLSSDLFGKNKYEDAFMGYGKDGKELYGVAGGPGGMSAKLGELMVVGDGKYGFVYSIRTGEFPNGHLSGNGALKSKINELGFMVLDRTCSVLMRKKVREGNDVEYLNAAKYGRNILLAWLSNSMVSLGKNKGLSKLLFLFKTLFYHIF